MNLQGNQPVTLFRWQLVTESAGKVRLDQVFSYHPYATALQSVLASRYAEFRVPADTPGSRWSMFLIRHARYRVQFAGSFQFSMDDLLHAVFIQPSIQRETPVYHDQWRDNRTALDKIKRLAGFFIVADH
jgi:hypothetical protein